MAYAPKHDSGKSNGADEPLCGSELIVDWLDRHDSGVTPRLESYKEEDPDQKNGDDTDRECNEEPYTP